jgi:hypothetical protein
MRDTYVQTPPLLIPRDNAQGRRQIHNRAAYSTRRGSFKGCVGVFPSKYQETAP